MALEGELASHFQTWGYWEPISPENPLRQALLEMRRAIGPFWLRVERTRLFLAFPGGGAPTNPLLPPEAALARWVGRLRREVEGLEGLIRGLGSG